MHSTNLHLYHLWILYRAHTKYMIAHTHTHTHTHKDQHRIFCLPLKTFLIFLEYEYFSHLYHCHEVQIALINLSILPPWSQWWNTCPTFRNLSWFLRLSRASQILLVVNNQLANAGRHKRVEGLIPGLGRSPAGRHDNPLQYSCL